MFYNQYPYTDYSQLNLDWFLAEFKQLKEDWQATGEAWSQMQLDFQTLEGTVQTFTTFVENYFENLDVQEEINTKLNQMALDGTLADLLAPLVDDKLPGVVDDKLGAVVTDQLPGVVTDQLPGVVSDQIGDAVAPEVPTAVTSWLNDNVDPVGSAVTVDSSLTIAGSAADAKVVGDKITDLTQKTNVLISSDGLTPITMTSGKAINCNSLEIDITDLADRPNFACAVVPCVAGDVFIITASGTGNYRTCCFVRADGHRLFVTASGTNYANERVVAPALTSYLIINDGSNSVSYKGDYALIRLALAERLNSLKISKTPGKNLFDAYNKNILDGYYINANGTFQDNANFCISDYIEVTAGETYAISNCYNSNCAVNFYDEYFNLISTETGGPSTVTAPAGAAYMKVPVLQAKRYDQAQIEHGSSATFYEPYKDIEYASVSSLFTPYDNTATYRCGDIVAYNGIIYKAVKNIDTAEDFTPGHWMDIRIPDGVVFGDDALSVSGSSLAANTKVETGKTNIAKNAVYQFHATFSEFSGIEIGHGDHSSKYASWITISSTTLTVYANTGTGTPESAAFTHGLTIADFINVQIITNDAYKCTVNIQSSDGNYTTPDLSKFFGNCEGTNYFTASKALTDYGFTFVIRDAAKPVYLFGDSYMSFASNRWVYYLKNFDQFNNVLISAVGGGNSSRIVNGMQSLNGRPKYALWCVGMNDPSDLDINTPDSAWLAGVNAFLAWCSSRNCIPVFGTVPTTPDYEVEGVPHAGKYNEGKNKWIRDSGYRYIDFAAALGADGSGNWYSGMLTPGDYVHPTIQGAIASFNRAVSDFPEILANL